VFADCGEVKLNGPAEAAAGAVGEELHDCYENRPVEADARTTPSSMMIERLQSSYAVRAGRAAGQAVARVA
jgi:hypothetical protein